MRVRENSLDTYLKEIRKYPLLEKREEIELMQRYREGDESALNQLVQSNLRFVVQVTARFQNLGLSLADLICEGNYGLMRAATKFDETRGVRFISYAVFWIRQSIMEALLRQTKAIRVPFNRSRALSQLKKNVRRLEQTLGRNPSDTEIAEVMQIDISELNKLKEVYKPARHLDSPRFEGSDEVLSEYIPAGAPGPEERLNERELHDLTVGFLSMLTERQARILELYYGLNGNRPMTLDQIGDIYGITRERVRQIREQALKLIRHKSQRSNPF